MVIFLFFTNYTEQIVMANVHVQCVHYRIRYTNKYISKSVKYVLVFNMFFKELSGNFGFETYVLPRWCS